MAKRQAGSWWELLKKKKEENPNQKWWPLISLASKPHNGAKRKAKLALEEESA